MKHLSLGFTKGDAFSNLVCYQFYNLKQMFIIYFQYI